MDSKLPKENLKPLNQTDDYSDSDNESTSSLISASSSQSSSSKDVCPICLCTFKNQESAKPDICDHKFCLECLQEWSKKTNTCPIDRKVFKSIKATDSNRVINVENRQQTNPLEAFEDVTYCEVCGRCDREDRLLLCDGCDRGFHCECLTPRLNDIPEGTWFCQQCSAAQQRTNRRQARETNPSQSHLRQTLTFIRPIVRTRLSERVRESVNFSRIERGVYIIVSESETDDFDTEDEEEYDDDEISENETLQLETQSTIDDSISNAIDRALNTTIIPLPKFNKPYKPVRRTTRRKRRKTKRKRIVTKIGKDGKPVKRKTVRKRRKRYRRVTSKSAPSIQSRILNSIQKAQQRQSDSKNSRDYVNAVTLNGIELDLMTDKRKRSRGPIFPKRQQPWFQNSILNEIDETDPSVPLSSMSLIRQDHNDELNSEQQRVNTAPTTSKQSKSSFDLLNNILSSQKVLLAPSSQVKVKRDGTVGLVEPQTSKQAAKRHKMEESNILLTNAPYDPFNPDDDDEEQITSKTAPISTEKCEILDSVENKSTKTTVKTEAKETVNTTTNNFNSNENVENNKESDSKLNQIKKENKSRDRSRSPYAKKRRSRSRTRSKSPKNRIDNKKSTVKSVKKEQSRSRSSSRDNNYKRTNSHYKSHHNHHRHSDRSTSRMIKKSRSRSNSSSRQHKKHTSSRTDDKLKTDKHNDIKSKNSKLNSTDNTQIKKENSQLNRSPNYSDSLIEQMISEEQQLKIDINAIKLPTINEIIKQNDNNNLIKLEPIEKVTSTTQNNSLDKRLNQLFGATDTNPKIKQEKIDEIVINKKSNGTKEPNEIIIKKEMVTKEEPYDLEQEYQNAEPKSKTASANGTNDIKANIKQEKTSKVDHESKILLNNQDKIVNAAKTAIKPYYVSKKINKDDYKEIMKKVVTKSLEHNKKGSIINVDQVTKLVSAYAKKVQMQNKQNK